MPNAAPAETILLASAPKKARAGSSFLPPLKDPKLGLQERDSSYGSTSSNAYGQTQARRGGRVPSAKELKLQLF